MSRPVGLTRAELAFAEQEVCPVPRRIEGYWLGSAAQWRLRALRAEAELARTAEALVNALAEARLKK